jgi:hypothetical protein
MEIQLATNREREIFTELLKSWTQNHLQYATRDRIESIIRAMYQEDAMHHQRAHGLNHEPISVRN